MNRKPSRKSARPDDISKLVAIVQDEAEGLLLVAMTTRQSVFDIIALRWGDVDFARSIIRLRGAKAHKVLEAPLDDAVRTWLRRHPRPVDPNVRLFGQLAAYLAPRAKEYRDGVSSAGAKCGLKESGPPRVATPGTRGRVRP